MHQLDDGIDTLGKQYALLFLAEHPVRNEEQAKLFIEKHTDQWQWDYLQLLPEFAFGVEEGSFDSVEHFKEIIFKVGDIAYERMLSEVMNVCDQ